MKAILLLLLACLTATAAPKLESPRAGSVPKFRAMTIPITEPRGPMTLAITRHVNLLFCNTNDAGCVLWTMQDVQTIQRAGYELRIYFANAANEDRALLMTSGAAPFDRDTGFNWPIPDDQFPQARIFFAIETIAPTFAPASAGIVVAPAYRQQVSPWTRRR